MSFQQQLILLLSEPPGSLIYHLVTLLAVQATLAIALSQWRRNPHDDFARRLTLAAGGILIGRLLALFTSLAIGSDAERGAAVLPILEQATNAATTLFLVWALAWRFERPARLGEALLGLSLLLVIVLYVVLGQTWQREAAAGVSYFSTGQATFWELLQLLILVAGVIATLTGRQRDKVLCSLTLGTLGVFHLLQWRSVPPPVIITTGISHWVRLGHLIALPLLAAVAYRHTLAELLGMQLANRPAAEQLAHSLRLSSRILDKLESETTIQAAVAVTAEAIEARLVGLALIPSGSDTDLRLFSLHERPDGRMAQTWHLNLADWPAFRLALEQSQAVELLPDGLGARQLHDLYEEMGLNDLGALLIQPLFTNSEHEQLTERDNQRQSASSASHSQYSRPLGLLLLAGPPGRAQWPAAVKSLTPALAGLLAQAVHNSQAYEQALQRATTAATPLPADNGQLTVLQAERERALAEVKMLRQRLRQAELAVQQRGQEQQKAVAAAQSADERLKALTAQVAALRESLVEAEEALAVAASGDGVSPTWVTRTMDRYTAELSQAQERIRQLEAQVIVGK